MENLLRFLHQRSSSSASAVSFLLRSGFATLFLFERYLFSSQIDVLLYPSLGLIPFETAHKHSDMNPYMWTILQAAPNSERLLTILYQLGIFHGCCLMLGIFPRFQLAGILFNLVCFHNHNLMVWESSDTLFRISCFFMLFLPIQKYGMTHRVFSRNPKINQLQSSSPMWPFRLYQAQLTIMYLSTTLHAWSFESWKSGDAFFYIRNSDSWNPMFDHVDDLFTSITASRYMTWGALFLFSTCWWLVWVPCFRKPVVTTMVCFHLFIETLTNTYFLNTLLALGWLTFLVEPDSSIRPANPESQIAVTFLVALILFVVFVDAFPLEVFNDYLPKQIQPALDVMVYYQYQAYFQIEPFLCMTGLWQGMWDISHFHEPHERNSFQAFLRFADDSEYTWKSPDFTGMSWLEKKQHGRVINYFASLPNPDAATAALKLCDELRENYGSDMSACELLHLSESDPLPPTAKSGIFAPRFDEMERYYRSVVHVVYCIDRRDDCEALWDDDEDFCETWGVEECAHTCGDCAPIVQWGSSVQYQRYLGVSPEKEEEEEEEDGVYVDDEDGEYLDNDKYHYASVDDGPIVASLLEHAEITGSALFGEKADAQEDKGNYYHAEEEDDDEDDYDEEYDDDENDYDEEDTEYDDDEDDDEEDKDEDNVAPSTYLLVQASRVDGNQSAQDTLQDERSAVGGIGNTAVKTKRQV